ncbi:TIGR01459 family HAD-type hydrolase [Sediminicoccus sp. KRV36]|uniref:TIGR01459 family HAD-type hydrolase n=1 Tax=Sediminicoccus sp. KRV36 TaxID=3133721 RepID=UPI00200CAE93|nr:TIGR01459 family HAD-type hydrolase [Sediminicoccus rosea]UPY36620.1 TIGR01459 family HAD-type hydrolase [Sediminicoccus rosea]
MTIQIFENLAPLADRYDGYVLDLWGVVHDGRQPYPGVLDCLTELKARGKRVVFLTNAPRRGWFIQTMLDGMGIERDLYAGIMSSGEVSWLWLKERQLPWFAKLGPRAYHIGPERDLSVVEDGAAELVKRPEDAHFLLNTGPDPERKSKSVEPYRDELRACFEAGLPMLCVNPDRAVMVAGDRLICAGALADIYLEWGGDVFEAGKPDAAVYGPVMDLLGMADKSRVLAIGDTPHTDLAGARNAGIDSLWALTGLTADAHGQDPSPGLLAHVLAEEGEAPIAALRSLRW